MTATIQTTKTTFKKVESEWYNYHNTLKEIARLEKVEDKQTITIRQLYFLKHVTEVIEQVYNNLPSNYKELVRLKYWSKNKQLTWEYIALELYISERQARRWRNEIVQATTELLGWR